MMKKRCPECGQLFTSEFSFCQNDGADLISIEASPLETSPVEASPVVSAGPSITQAAPAVNAQATISPTTQAESLAPTASGASAVKNRSVTLGMIGAGIALLFGVGMFLSGNQSRQQAAEELRLAAAARAAAEQAQAEQGTEVVSSTDSSTTNSNSTLRAEGSLEASPITGSSSAVGATTRKPQPTPSRLAPSKATPTKAAPSAKDMEAVKGRYGDWVAAWENRDIDGYMKFYSASVLQKRAGKPSYGFSQQRKRMSDNWAKQSFISIQSQNPQVSTTGSRLVMTIQQTYDSSTWWDKGTKRLVWAKESGEWKIVEESFQKQDGGPK